MIVFWLEEEYRKHTIVLVNIRAVKAMIVVDGGDSVGECKWSVRRYEE